MNYLPIVFSEYFRMIEYLFLWSFRITVGLVTLHFTQILSGLPVFYQHSTFQPSTICFLHANILQYGNRVNYGEVVDKVQYILHKVSISEWSKWTCI